nr:hypothetical protein BaRGS_013100 [Batillaria attramentaria]
MVERWTSNARPGNEEADRLAKSGSRKEQPQQAVSYTEAKTLGTQKKKKKMSREQLTREVTELKELGDRLQEQVDTLRDEKASLEARLAAIESKQAETGKKVAFLARLSVSNVKSNIPIHFPRVAFNIGTAFNPNTGVFTVPIAGVYIITFQVT